MHTILQSRRPSSVALCSAQFQCDKKNVPSNAKTNDNKSNENSKTNTPSLDIKNAFYRIVLHLHLNAVGEATCCLVIL